MIKLVPAALLSAAAVLTLAACSKAVETPSPFRTEQHYIVSAIGTDLSQILAFAAKQKKNDIDLAAIKLETVDTSPPAELSGPPQPPDSAETSQKFQYKLSLGKGEPENTTVYSKGYIWNPANYLPWIKQLESRLGVSAKANSPDTSALVELLANYTTEGLAKANSKTAQLLSAHPLDQHANEEAALICSIWALRENAGCFTDMRHWLNRITAHLALAEAATGNGDEGAIKLSTAGKLSDIVLLTLAGRESAAVKQIDDMESALASDTTSSQQHKDEVSSWLRALRIRATHDFRVAKLDKLTHVEQLEYARALSTRLNTDAVTDYLQQAHPKDFSIDWFHIGMHGESTVESGHYYCEQGIQADIADTLAESQLYGRTAIKQLADLNHLLSEQRTGCLVNNGNWQLTPVSWGDLSEFHNRHLQDAIYQDYHFRQNMWRVPDQARDLKNDVCRRYASLPMFAFCKLNLEVAESDKYTADGSLTGDLKNVLVTHPELVTFELWRLADEHSSLGDKGSPSWFNPVFPVGTAYDADNRAAFATGRLTLADGERLHELSPYEREVAFLVMKKAKKKEDGDFAAKMMGSLLDYDQRAIYTTAVAYQKTSKEKYAEYVERGCKYQPDRYFILGDLYAESDPPKAFAAYEKAVKLGRNDVLMANDCSWLVNYYYDHGQKDEALKLANHAAEVYSFSGLETKADLSEKMGDLQEAEEYYKKIDDRYDDSGPLCAFYLRNGDKSPAYKEAATKFVAKVFPKGLRKFEPLAAAPKLGVRIDSSNARTAQAGMQVGDIVVAVNDYFVANEKQYGVARALGQGPKVKFVFWHGGAYKTSEISLPDKRLHCSISDYQS